MHTVVPCCKHACKHIMLAVPHAEDACDLPSSNIVFFISTLLMHSSTGSYAFSYATYDTHAFMLAPMLTHAACIAYAKYHVLWARNRVYQVSPVAALTP